MILGPDIATSLSWQDVGFPPDVRFFKPFRDDDIFAFHLGTCKSWLYDVICGRSWQLIIVVLEQL